MALVLERSMGNEYFNSGDLPKRGSMFENFPDPKNTTYGDFKNYSEKIVHIQEAICHDSLYIHTKESLVIKKLIHLFDTTSINLWIDGERNIGKSEAIL